jgi:hypothetical protein
MRFRAKFPSFGLFKDASYSQDWKKKKKELFIALNG